MLKVLRITPLLDFGGIEKRLVNTAKEEGLVEFVFVALGHGGWASDQITGLGKRVIIMEQSFRIPNVRLLLALIRLLKKEKPDVVHTSGAEANFHGILAAWLCRVPVIVGEEIGFPNHGQGAQLIFRFLYSLSDQVIAISEAVKAKLVQLKELPSSICRVVYNPVILPETGASHAIDQPILRLLMVSRLEPVKNIEIVLRILNRHRALLPPFHLVIVGDGTYRTRLEDQVSLLEMKKVVTFAGFQSDPNRFYQEADVFLLPSFSEGLSNSLLEAMSYGLVCIATKEGGPSELIRHGDTGYLIDPYSESDIESVLSGVLHMKRAERLCVGAQARKFLDDGFSIRAYVNQLINIYEDGLKKS